MSSTGSSTRSVTRSRTFRAGLSASAALAILATPLLATSQAHAAPRPKASTGETCTIVGTSGRDVLKGTNGRDVICGLGGSDTIKGRGGNDVLDGGAGKDKIEGGAGNDVILGGSGKDAVSGGSGRDQLDGGSGNDSLKGGSSGDFLMGDSGNDKLDGGSGSDGLFGSSGKDKYVGAAGDDRCDFVSGRDASRSSCVADQSAPSILSAKADRPKVDSRTGDTKVTVSVAARDDMAAYVDFHFVGLRLNTTGPGSWETPTSGTSKDGVWTQTFIIPKGTPSGTYDLHVQAWDAVHAEPTTKIFNAVVTNTGVTFAQPEVTSFSTSAPSVIDTRTGTTKVTYTATIADPQQRMTKDADLTMQSVTGRTSTDLDGRLTRTGGTATKGTWTTSRTFTKGDWPSDTYDWVLRTESKEGTTTTWVGPTLWETTYKGKAGYRLLPGAKTFSVSGTGTTNQYAPELRGATIQSSTTMGKDGASVAWSARVSDRDHVDNLVTTVYLQSVKDPGVWFSSQTHALGWEDGLEGTAEGTIGIKPTAPRGEYRVWVLLSDGGVDQYGHHVWYGPSGVKPPTATTPGPVTFKGYPTGMTTTVIVR